MSWDALPPGARAALEQQWLGVAAGALPCGAAIVDRDGYVVAAGRSHAYDPATGTDPLEQTPIAHAEFNALARVRGGDDLGAMTLWSTQRPCAMCSAAIDFVGVGSVTYVAEDPSPAVQSTTPFTLLGDPYWADVATALFVLIGAFERGRSDGNLARLAEHDPELAGAVLHVAASDTLGVAARAGASLPDALGALPDGWPRP